MAYGHLKKLLALTDFSAPARHAAERATLLAKDAGAVLDLLHVVTTGPMEQLQRLSGGVPAGVAERLVDAVREEMQELAKRLERHRGVAPGIHVAQGALLASLLEQADRLDPDLIVLGAHGVNYMRHLLLGSTAERMLRKTGHPLLVVKQQPHDAYKRVLVPVDFSAASQPAIALAKLVAPEAEIVLLHAFEVPFEGKLQFAGIDEIEIARYRAAANQEANAKLRDLIRDTGLPPGSTMALALHGNPSRRIVEQEQERDCDLIVIGKHGESLIEDLLLGSVTKHVLVECQGDVVVSV